jgi:hypothetical protein
MLVRRTPERVSSPRFASNCLGCDVIPEAENMLAEPNAVVRPSRGELM